MPLVKIEILKGHTKVYKETLRARSLSIIFRYT